MDRTLALLTDYACGASAAGFDDAAWHECRRRIVDAFGCALAGMNEAPVRMARAAALRAPVADGACLVGSAQRVLPEWAAFANGIAVRCLEGNDCFLGGGGHPSDAVMGVLAAAQALGAGARDAMAGVIVAYEVHYALYRRLPVRDHGIDPPFYTGMATAAGVARALRLPSAQAAQALSLAAMSSLGLEVARRGELSMWKNCAGASAARNGVFHALLARAGMTAPPAPFDGEHGLWDLIGRHELGPLPHGPAPAMAQASYKRYLTEYHSQAAVIAALELAAGVEPDRIAAIHIETYRFAHEEIGSGPEKWRPATRETADHSLPYIVAASLVDGAFSDAVFQPARFADPRILALIDKITVAEDPAFTADFPAAVPCRVTLATIGGGRRRQTVRHPPGHPANPMSDAQLAGKFRELAGRTLPAARMENLLHGLWRLGEESTLDDIFLAANAA